MAELPTVPVALRVHLAHATLQAVADAASVDVLHLKGPAFEPSLRPADRAASIDADLLVRPSQLRSLAAALTQDGWHEVIPLRSRGVLHHSTNWYHPQLGQADLHVRFPGIQVSPEDAFRLLWRDRKEAAIAHLSCPVPDLVAQRLIVLLHAAREPQARASEVDIAWTQASGAEREAVTTLATTLNAEVALAAAVGGLDRFQDRPEYALWRSKRDGASPHPRRLTSLIATMRAAPAGSRGVVAAAALKVVRGLGRRASGRTP